ILTVYPGPKGQFELYEDDGTTDAYKRGEYEVTAISSALIDNQTLEISIAAAQGHCSTLPEKRKLELRLKGVAPAKRVTVNDQHHADWTYDATTCELVIMLSETDRHVPVTIQAQADGPISALNAPRHSTVAPFVHVVDYETFDDARQQLGTM